MESNGRLGRKDTTKGPPLRILSLDGGGVRGYSMLIIIQELMHRTYVETEGRAPRRDQIPKPCDHFDLICGTGTGGLIAIMLGRLRLDLETCKEVYVRMTRRVFETDKTIAGIPYRSTLFKASKLEEAIKECVREHTIYESEGNDGPPVLEEMSPMTPLAKVPQRHASNASVVSFSARSPTSYGNRPMISSRWGNANALLYDTREKRTKTAVTAIYKGTSKGGRPAFLRSYDSRAEPAPEVNCTIWQAGRATSATGLAFKPIQVGQSVFIDEGAGQYNPAPFVLDEATINEWPGREVGVFVSIGTGKRPPGTDANQHLWYEDFMGDFAEARKRLISKIEGCEETHQYMLREYLAKRGINTENYYRLNVKIGVGEFGMNEWNRLADISTGTRRYLAEPEVQRMNLDAAAKLAKIHFAKMRLEGKETHAHSHLTDIPEAAPGVVELPAEIPPGTQLFRDSPRPSYESGREESFTIAPLRLQPHTSEERERDRQRRNGSPSGPTLNPASAAHTASSSVSSTITDDDRFISHAPTPSQYRTAGGQDMIAIMSHDEYPRPKPSMNPQSMAPPPLPDRANRADRINSPDNRGKSQSPPPLPPKTPIQEVGLTPEQARTARGRMFPPPQPTGPSPPYPMDDGPPPVVNLARKPEYKAK